MALNATRLELQEDWTTFVIGPIPKHLHTDTLVTITTDHVIAELSSYVDSTHIRKLEWTNKSHQLTTEGYIRALVTSLKPLLFPAKLRLFGRPVTVNRIKRKVSIPVCERCFAYHHTRTCARLCRCSDRSKPRHDGPCTHPERCLNCLGPHKTTDNNCLARPKIEPWSYPSPIILTEEGHPLSWIESFHEGA